MARTDENRVEAELLRQLRRVAGKGKLLYKLAKAARGSPDGMVEAVIYPVVPANVLDDLIRETEAEGSFERNVRLVTRGSYSHHYRRVVPLLLEALEFNCNNERHRPVMRALELLKKHRERKSPTFPSDEDVPLEGVVQDDWHDLVLDEKENGRVNRIAFEICVLDTLRGTGMREGLERDTLQRRLLLSLHGLGTNAGLKRMCSGGALDGHDELRYVHRDGLRAAIARVCNAIFAARDPAIWGEATMAVASDSKQFGAWDQNLMTEYHACYGGRGIMVYWYVDKHSACIHSELKACSSSEVAAMIEGVMRHETTMEIEKACVDSHGQSEIGFAFCHLLGFSLLPRLKHMKKQRLYRVEKSDLEEYANLKSVFTRTIDWSIIEQQYDEMVKFATALRLGTADAETILRRFTRGTVHPSIQLTRRWVNSARRSRLPSYAIICGSSRCAARFTRT